MWVCDGISCLAAGSLAQLLGVSRFPFEQHAQI